MVKSVLEENTFGLRLPLLRLKVAVDNHSKWPEVFVMKETTATKTNKIVHVIFARLDYQSKLLWTVFHNLYQKISFTY